MLDRPRLARTSTAICALLLNAAIGTFAKAPAAHYDEASPAQWSSDDVYDILHRSPWSRTVKVSHSEKAFENDNASPDANVPVNNGTAGGMGRRRMGGTYSSAAPRSSNRPTSPGSMSAEVLVQWQSALPVRLAADKAAGRDPADFKEQTPQNYMIGVVDLPLVDIGGRAATLDSGSTTDEEEKQRLAKLLQGGTQLLRPGHDALKPTKVELDQGKDGRIVFYFPKSDPITAADKTVEFRMAVAHTKIEKKFPLKEMEYHGRLDL